MSRSPRAEALRLVGGGQEIPAPPMPDVEPNSPPALEFLNDQEERRYAALALTIDLLFDKVFETRPERPPDGLIRGKSEARELDAWQQLALDMNNTFIADVTGLRQTAEYKNATDFNQLFGMLHPVRSIDLELQLMKGAGTGTNSVLTLLRNAPHLIRRYNADCSAAEVASIMRHPQSNILLRKLAKVSVNQMMAARSVIAGDSEYHDWTDIDHVFKPQHFQLQIHPDNSASMTYADFEGLWVPAGYTPHPTVEAVHRATFVKDIRGNRPKVIGCPVTLVQNRLAELLNWGIELVEARDLWSEDWPYPQQPSELHD